ncbi:hypothetical protein HAV15_001266 [Penicillium sp. str. |nr:hypothetical protein HAV15_001266 [Penicillium sp. str. \
MNKQIQCGTSGLGDVDLDEDTGFGGGTCLRGEADPLQVHFWSGLTRGLRRVFSLDRGARVGVGFNLGTGEGTGIEARQSSGWLSQYSALRQ